MRLEKKLKKLEKRKKVVKEESESDADDEKEEFKSEIGKKDMSLTSLLAWLSVAETKMQRRNWSYFHPHWLPFHCDYKQRLSCRHQGIFPNHLLSCPSERW